MSHHHQGELLKHTLLNPTARVLVSVGQMWLSSCIPQFPGDAEAAGPRVKLAELLVQTTIPLLFLVTLSSNTPDFDLKPFLIFAIPTPLHVCCECFTQVAEFCSIACFQFPIVFQTLNWSSNDQFPYWFVIFNSRFTIEDL